MLPQDPHRMRSAFAPTGVNGLHPSRGARSRPPSGRMAAASANRISRRSLVGVILAMSSCPFPLPYPRRRPKPPGDHVRWTGQGRHGSPLPGTHRVTAAPAIGIPLGPSCKQPFPNRPRDRSRLRARPFPHVAGTTGQLQTLQVTDTLDSERLGHQNRRHCLPCRDLLGSSADAAWPLEHGTPQARNTCLGTKNARSRSSSQCTSQMGDCKMYCAVGSVKRPDDQQKLSGLLFDSV